MLMAMIIDDPVPSSSGTSSLPQAGDVGKTGFVEVREGRKCPRKIFMKYVTAFLAGVLLALSGCRSLAPQPGPPVEDDPVAARTFEASYSEVYEAALAAADAMRWAVTEADLEGRLITADTPEAAPRPDLQRDAYAGAESDVYVVFEETDVGVRVEVTPGVRWQSEVEDVNAFLEGVAARL